MVISLYREGSALLTTVPEVPTRGDRELLMRLENSVILRDYRSAFHASFGLTLAIHPAGSFHPVHQNWAQNQPFCARLAPATGACPSCARLQHWIEHDTSGETRTFQCLAGPSESVIPIRIGERIVGFLRTGRVLLHPPAKKRFSRLQEQSFRGGAKPKHPPLAMRVIAKRHYESGLQFLAIFAEHLSLLGNQMTLTKTVAESPAITKARLFIANHHGEFLSLAAVARAVYMSPFYFCRKFKQETGLRFTAYVARLRIEKAQQSLLQRHTRITEAAFAAGFQSVSQFNRIFRQVTGESPTNYRDRLGVTERVPSSGGCPCRAA